MYCYAMAQLFVVEVGPLLTVRGLLMALFLCAGAQEDEQALLLAGRIGGSYAGEVATKQATNQVTDACCSGGFGA